jgi:hypothetical protein
MPTQDYLSLPYASGLSMVDLGMNRELGQPIDEPLYSMVLYNSSGAYSTISQQRNSNRLDRGLTRSPFVSYTGKTSLRTLTLGSVV